MDPLSVAASIAGLATAGAQIISLLQGFIDAPSIAQIVGDEINHFIVVLAQLQPFVLGSSSADQSRTSMIEVQQIQIILTGCVLTFSELQAAVNGLGEGSAGKIGIRGRLKWAMAESTIAQYIQRLRDHKCSLTLILTVLTCKSTSQAVNSITELRGLLEQYIQQNTDILNRVLELENEPPTARAYSMTGSSIRSWTSYAQDFEAILFDSRLYRGAWKKRQPSFKGSRPSSVNWSVLSGFSLSQVSNIAVFHLAVSAADLSNPECYTIVPRHSSAMRLEEMRSKASHQIAMTRFVGQHQKLNRSVFSGQPLLHIAAEAGDHKTVRALLEVGADVEGRDKQGNTALHIASEAGDHETVRALLEVGADVEGRDKQGNIALHLAASAGRHTIVQFLLESGAYVEAKQSSGRSPLHVAAARTVRRIEDDTEYDMTMQVLLELGASPDERTDSGRTALHYAASSGRADSVRALLRAGANREISDLFSITPVEMAKPKGHVDIVKLLQEWGTGDEVL